MHGICYLANDTQANKIQWKRIKPLIGLGDQFYDVKGTNYRSPKYMFGEMGVSVKLSKDGKTMLIGAPGIWDWSGSVVELRQNTDHQWISVVANPTQWRQPKFSYFGYAVTTGRFFKGHTRNDILVASAPRAAETFGEVYVFSMDSAVQLNGNISIKQTLRGHQMGEYFGYALVAEDFNGDGTDELVVAAPLNAMDDSFDNGKVYVYGSRGNGLEIIATLLATGNVGHAARFGTAVAKIGDLNGDGYNGKVLLSILFLLSAIV